MSAGGCEPRLCFYLTKYDTRARRRDRKRTCTRARVPACNPYDAVARPYNTRREDLIIVGNWSVHYLLYCDSTGELRNCLQCKFDRVKVPVKVPAHAHMIKLCEPRAVKYLLWYHLRSLTERAVYAFALDIIPDIQRVIARDVLNASDEYSDLIYACKRGRFLI